MPCLQPDISMSDARFQAYVNALDGNELNEHEIAEKVNEAIFRVRSALRELEKAAYIEQTVNGYVLTNKATAT